MAPPAGVLNGNASPSLNDMQTRIKRPRISPHERQRAPAACTSCRSSKIRCSSSTSGIPCSHCLLRGVPCVVKHNQRSENIKQRPVKQLRARREKSELATSLPAILIPSDDGSSEKFTTDSGSHIEELAIQEKTAAWSIPAHYQSWIEWSLGTHPVLPSHNLLPSYIKPLPAHISRDDVEYLTKQGALSVPDLELRDELLRCYIEFVPGNLPGPDWHDILAHIEQRTSGPGGLSLLLFQAVMFVATAFIDLEHLKTIGFQTRRAARQAFFKKVRVLYEFDCENDRISVVQSLLLMTYWFETSDDEKDGWYWMGLALSTASTIGLDRDTKRADINEKERRLRRRLWWSCVMRDPIIALGMKRPARIRQADYNIPMLTLEDFDISAVSDNTSSVSAKCALARDEKKQYHQAIMCIEQAKLCQIIGNILYVHYDIFDSFPKGRGVDSNCRTTVVLLPISREQDTDEFNHCDEELQSWLQGLPEEAMYTPLQANGLGKEDRGLVLLCAMGHLIYFLGLNALHRPRSRFSSAFQPATSTGQLPSYVETSRAVIHKAATGITSIVRDLHQHGLSNLIPLTGLSAILPAMLSHLVSFQSPDKILREQAVEAYEDCMAVIQEIGKTYPAADFTVQFLEAAAHRVMGFAVEDIRLYGRQAAAHTREHVEVVNLEQTLNIPDTHPVDEVHQRRMSCQSASDQEMKFSPFYSLQSPPFMGNREDAELGPFGIRFADIHSPEGVVLEPFNDIFNFGEVGAFFWPDDWVCP